MIIGSVNSDLDATIRILIEDVNGQSQAIDVKIDTGYTGFLSLPAATVATLGLPATGIDGIRIGDGSTVMAQVHSGVVIWDGKPRTVDVHAMGVDRLIGMRMLASHDLAIRIQDGGVVSISFVP